jgi:hypothetical protein
MLVGGGRQSTVESKASHWRTLRFLASWVEMLGVDFNAEGVDSRDAHSLGFVQGKRGRHPSWDWKRGPSNPMVVRDRHASSGVQLTTSTPHPLFFVRISKHEV